MTLLPSAPAQAAIVFTVLSGLLSYNEALAQPDATAERPMTYALVAAMGKSFSFVAQKKGLGSRLEPYDRRNIDMPEDGLNRLVLHNLDELVGASAPDSKRIFLSVPTPAVNLIAPANREQAAIDAVVKALQDYPARATWDQIVVVTPAYRLQSKNDMASMLGGFGIFIQPMCRSTDAELRCDTPADLPAGPATVLTPDGKKIASTTYQAPFSYLSIWILDPKTLEVISKEQVFDDQKLNDLTANPLSPVQSMNKQFTAKVMNNLIGTSIRNAIRRSGLTAKVEVREVEVEGHEVKD